jgi:Flp pilus assembly protein TadG
MWRDRSGNAAILFTLCASLMCVAGGVAIDYSRNTYTKSTLDAALDAAVISVARDLKMKKIRQADVLARAQTYFTANFDAANHGAKVTGFDVRFKGTDVHVALYAEANEQNIFGGVLGKDMTTVRSTAEATYAFQSVEVALVLDVTGSMAANGKILALKDAAHELLDVLLGKGLGENVKISLVPYSQGVNLGTLASAATAGESTTCATERTGAEAATDAPPSLAPIQGGSSNCPAVAIVPLTSDGVALRTAVDRLSPVGSTAGHTGIAWGWYGLAPHWTEFWPIGSRPEDYDVGGARLKVAVVMTDGEFNTVYDRTNGTTVETMNATAASAARARALCTAMKGKGIRLYTVSFSAGSEAEKLLEDCATDRKKTYFKATDADELTAAFLKIGADVSSFYLSR